VSHHVDTQDCFVDSVSGHVLPAAAAMEILGTK
jgi:hypothetical protein